MSFPRYPKYKASGVEWLGEVPEEWGVQPLRYICNVRKGKLPGATFPNPTAETDLPYLSMEYLRGELDCPEYVSVSKNIVCAESGDILLLWDGSNAGEFLRAKQGAVSSTVALIEPKNIAQQFLFFACKSRERELKDQTIGMGIPHVSGDTLKSFAIPAPPLSEQTAIAEFLDRETGKIDDLVAEQRRLMELLKEKRQAVISHAVTKGLNPQAPMKPSGIEWLGDVQVGWSRSRLGFEAWVRARLGWKGLKAEEYVDDGFAFLATPNLKANAIDFVDVNYITQERYDESPEIKLAVGDVLLVKDGATLGIVNIVRHLPRPTTVNGSIAVITPGNRLTGLFLYFLLMSSSFQQVIQRVKGGMGVPHLFQSDLNKFYVPIPPLSEQAAIAEFLESETAKFDTLTAEAQRAIDLLQERRTALISAAVTGQIDVRNQPRN